MAKPTDAQVRKVMAELGRRGGRATQAARTPEERTRIAREAVIKRWARVKSEKAVEP